MDPAIALARVIEVIRAEFPMLRKMALEADTALLSAGLLDSFAIVTMLAALDKRFAIDLDVEALALEQFETPGSIAALCLGAIRGGGGG